MATQALLNVFCYVGGHDFTGSSNQATLNSEVTALDSTTFRNGGWTSVKGGAKSATFELAGFWQAPEDEDSTAVDPELFAALGAAPSVHTFGLDEVAGSVAYLWKAGRFSYQVGGTYNEMAPFTVSAQGADAHGVIRGQLAKPWDEEPTSAAGPLGGALQLGAGAAGKKLYATVHGFEVGTTVTVAVESDTTAGFASPTTVATFPALTARGALWLPPVDASGFTDTYYRLTVTAITGDAQLAGAIALQ
ncbi:hypothetical protein L3Q67_00970 [Saccharothrix sp. AJ9571]|nr:hypothetical protein L3Q67_00970 [Saccharothrix sp. AJ9571]